MTSDLVREILRASPRVLPLLGGQEIHVQELTRALEARGLRHTLVYAAGAPDPAGTEIQRLPVMPIPSTMARDALFGWKLSRLRRAPCDVVHTHGDAPVARGGARLAQRLGVPHVHTFHGGLVGRGIRGGVLRAFLPRHSWYLAVSRGVARGLARAGADPERIFVRPSGVRDVFFEADSARRADVVVGGRLILEKGIGDLVAAWGRAVTGASRLHVFGAGPEEPRIRRIAEVSPNVVWLGRLDQSELASVFGSAAAGVVTGRRPMGGQSDEGTPTVALEMLAAGCYTTVGTATGELPDVVRRLGLGEVHDEPPDPEHLRKLAALWSDPARNDVRTRARRHMEAIFGWPGIAEQIHRFYEEISRDQAAGEDA